jgi:DnaD/phage-associated family protein
MTAFDGFSDSEAFTPIPETFFRILLNEISDIDELKVALHAVWCVEHIEGEARGLSEEDFVKAGLGLEAAAVRSGLDKAVERRILLRSERQRGTLYFLNSPRGRAIARAAEASDPGGPTRSWVPPKERPNAFQLYEENIGPLTPLIADALRDAEATYSGEWLAEAIDLAVRHNKRNWKYCEAILKRWKEEGRGEKQNRRDDQGSRQRDVEEKIRRFIRG